ncbi:MAG: NAD(P)-dependent oxidoreductase [Methylococcaceae bacterium]|nr:NAD(P)-dependent oxidoreductase [Methylococcaceae bacterium]
MKVGVIGLGTIGLGMARNIAKSGLLDAIYNRTHKKATDFGKEINLTPCSSPQELAEQVDIILICVSKDIDVLQMINAIAETIKPNSVVIDLSTVSIETAQKAARILSKKQVLFLDAPVSGGAEGAKNGSLAIMVGGDKKTLKKVLPVLEIIGSRIIHIGHTGSGQGAKAVNQIMAAGINQAVTEALAFGQSQGLEMNAVIDVISGGAANNWFLQNRGTSMLLETFKPGFKVALHKKDLVICKKMAQQSGAVTNVIEQTLADYEKLIEQGYADEDISALYRLKKV